MSKLALILFLLIIIAYIVSYLRFKTDHFQSSTLTNEQLELALSFFDGLKYENNTFSIYDKVITNQIKGTFRLGMWKFEDNVNSITTYLNFLSNGKVHSFDTKNSDILATDTYEVSPSATNLDFNYGGQSYNFEYVNEDTYKIVGSNNIQLTKLKKFTIKTLCSATQGINCESVGNQKSLFYLNDIQYKIKYTNKISNTNYTNFGSEELISDFNGMHILVLNKNGSIYDFQHFDIWYYADEYLNAKGYLKQIPSGKIVAVNTYMGIADLGYPKIILVTTGGTHKAIYSHNEKNTDLINLTNPIEGSNLIVKNNNQNISKVLMSPGIELTLFADKLPNELEGTSSATTNDINVKSNDLNQTDERNFKVYNISANKQKNFKTMKVSYDFTGEDTIYDLVMKTLRNPIEGLMKIGSDYNLILTVGDSYSIIGIKDEPIGNAQETKISPYVQDNCPGKVVAISEGFDTSVSREFTLHAYKTIKTTFKVDVFSKGTDIDKNGGFSAFYVDDKYINLQTGNRGINMLVLNDDGTNYSFNSYDTHPRNYSTDSPLEKFLNDYEELDTGKIVCLSFVEEAINSAMQFAYLYQNNSPFGTMVYIPYQEESIDVSSNPNSFTLNGQYTLIWDFGFNLANAPSYIGRVFQGKTTNQVLLSPRTKLEIYGGGHFEQDDKTTITYSQMSGVNKRYTLPTPKNINSAILVPDREYNNFVDIFDVIKDIGGSPNQKLSYRCDFAIIGKKGAPPNTAAYQYNESSLKTDIYGSVNQPSSPNNKIAHASREFDL